MDLRSSTSSLSWLKNGKSKVINTWREKNRKKNNTKNASWAPRVNSHSASRTMLVSPLELTVAKSAPLATLRKLANHSPQNQTHLPEINKPQTRISGVEISMCYPTDSNTYIEVTTHSTCLRLLPKFKNNLVLGSHCTGLHGRQWDTR
jgi:hypothetical protein